MKVLKANDAFRKCRFLPRPNFYSHMKCDFRNIFNG